MRVLEWADSLDALPGEWSLLEDAKRDIQGPDGTPFPARFRINLEQGYYLTCYFESWREKRLDAACYITERIYGAIGAHYLAEGSVVVRQVPPCLIFGCVIAVSEETRTWQAAFTTLAGKCALQVEETLSAILTMWTVVDRITRRAEAMRMLQSWNQKVRVLLNGSRAELPEETVLWRATLPLGWLQCRMTEPDLTAGHSCAGSDTGDANP